MPRRGRRKGGVSGGRKEKKTRVREDFIRGVEP